VNYDTVILLIAIMTAFILAAAFVLGAVALGGWLVYRTKRDPWEPMVAPRDKPTTDQAIPDTLSMANEQPINEDQLKAMLLGQPHNDYDPQLQRQFDEENQRKLKEIDAAIRAEMTRANMPKENNHVQ